MSLRVGRKGVKQPKVPGQCVPIGVIKMYNEISDKAVKTDEIGDSDKAQCKLFEGQLEQNYKGHVCKVAMQAAVSNHVASNRPSDVGSAQRPYCLEV